MSAIVNSTEKKEVVANFQEPSDVEEKLNCALRNVEAVRFQNALLQKENMDLKGDNEICTQSLIEYQDQLEEVRKENMKLKMKVHDLNDTICLQTEKVKESQIHTDFLQKMIDNANDATSSSRATSEEHQQEVQAYKAEIARLTRENKDHHDIMAEFGRIWSGDTKKYHQTVSKVIQDRDRLQKELFHLKKLRAEDQKQISDLQFTILENSELEKEYQLAIETNSAQRQQILEAGNQKAEDDYLSDDGEEEAILEKQEQLKKETDELRAAVEELYNSREKTTDQLETMKNKWIIERETYEAKISNMESEQQQAATNFSIAQQEWTNQIGALNAQIDENKRHFNHFHHQLQSALQQETGQRHFFQAESDLLLQDLLQVRNDLEGCLIRLGTEEEAHRNIVYGLETNMATMEAKLSENEQLTISQSSEISNLHDTLTAFEEQIDSLSSQVIQVTKQKTDALKEAERLREQLRVTMRDYIDDKERMEQQQDDAVEAVSAKFTQRIEEIRQNHSDAVAELQTKINTLNRGKDRVEGMNHKQKAEIVELTTIIEARRHEINQLRIDFARTTDNYTILMRKYDTLNEQVENEIRLKEHQRSAFDFQMKHFRDALSKQQLSYEYKLTLLEEEHKKLVDNMGVEALDDDVKEAEPIAAAMVESYEEDESSDGSSDEDDEEETEDEDEDEEDEDEDEEDDASESEPVEWEVVDQV